MASRRVDPARLEGDALRRWYQRTPHEIERERRAAADETYRAFTDSIQAALQAPGQIALKAAAAVRNAPDIQHPSLAQSFIPVVGPAWEAAADLQDGDYAGAAFNGAIAATELLPIGVAAKGLRMATKGVGAWKTGSLTAGAARSFLKRRNYAAPGEHIHHTVPLNGIPRNVPNWRNHYAFLKPLKEEQHKRLSGRSGTKPRYDPVRRVWYGTTDWMKAVPAGLTGYLADGVENLPDDPDPRRLYGAQDRGAGT